MFFCSNNFLSCNIFFPTDQFLTFRASFVRKLLLDDIHAIKFIVETSSKPLLRAGRRGGVKAVIVIYGETFQGSGANTKYSIHGGLRPQVVSLSFVCAFILHVYSRFAYDNIRTRGPYIRGRHT